MARSTQRARPGDGTLIVAYGTGQERRMRHLVLVVNHSHDRGVSKPR